MRPSVLPSINLFSSRWHLTIVYSRPPCASKFFNLVFSPLFLLTRPILDPTNLYQKIQIHLDFLSSKQELFAVGRTDGPIDGSTDRLIELESSCWSGLEALWNCLQNLINRGILAQFVYKLNGLTDKILHIQSQPQSFSLFLHILKKTEIFFFQICFFLENFLIRLSYY